MRKKQTVILIIFSAIFVAQNVRAQDPPEGFREAFLQHFTYSADRLLALSGAVPADKYAWRPGDGVMSIEEVYMHIARYNYYYPESSLGVDVPQGVNLETMETIAGKDVVRDHLTNSIDYVKHIIFQMSDEQLSQETVLYGREVQYWNVLLQLQIHMSEHVGQSIAYARMNGIVPPWSR